MPNAPSSPAIRLRPLSAADIPALFQIQLDPAGNAMAAVKPRDRQTFFARLTEILTDPTVTFRVIEENGAIVGSISRFGRDGLDYFGYWIAREHWGRGVATRAVELFLQEVPVRPLHARVAAANPASLRVLQRNGFEITGRQQSPETDRFLACEEVQLTLR